MPELISSLVAQSGLAGNVLLTGDVAVSFTGTLDPSLVGPR